MLRFPRRLLPAAFALAAFATAAVAADWAPNLTTAATWQDNAPNADRAADRLGAFALAADLSAAQRTALSPSLALLLGAHAAAESFPRFDALDRVTLGPRATLSRKFGLGPTAPVVALAFSADALLARDSARSGLGAAATLSWRQRLDEATLLQLATEASRLDARGAVYDRSASETSLTVTRTLDAAWQLAAVARLRFGDVLAHGTPPRPDLVALARVRTPVTTFDRPMVAYAFTARTVTAGLSLTRLLDARSSLTLAAEYRTTEKSAFRYVNRLVSATVAHQF